MKILLVEKKGNLYEFRFLEKSRIIQIMKNNTFSYQITFSRTFWKCSCPGARFHGKCWHVEIIKDLKALPSIQEPWAEWAEEAGLLGQKITQRR